MGINAKRAHSTRITAIVCSVDLGNGWSLDITNPQLLGSAAFCQVYFAGERIGSGLYAKASGGLLYVTVDLDGNKYDQLDGLTSSGGLYLLPVIAVGNVQILNSKPCIIGASFKSFELSGSKYYLGSEKIKWLGFDQTEAYK